MFFHNCKKYIYDVIVEKYTNVDLLIIDEAQFLTERQVNQLMDVVIDLKGNKIDSDDKRIIKSLDALRKEFDKLQLILA